MSVEQKVAGYYGRSGVVERIFAALGRDSGLTLDDLAPYDDMHIGGRRGTAALLESLKLAADAAVLEIGSGMGGPARFIAQTAGVYVTGIDLTPDYKDVAMRLSAATGLDEHTGFVTGSALAMPFDDGAFDAAYMIHVGMNIEDKAGLFAEAFRVVKPGGAFGIYDVMGLRSDELVFPLPWAENAETSFVRPAGDYRALLEQAGFEPADERDMKDFALESLAKVIDLPAQAPPLRSESFAVKVGNLYAAIKSGHIAPRIIIARKMA